MSLFKKQKTISGDISSSEDYLQFNGQIIYHKNFETIDKVLDPLLATISSESNFDNKIVIGFDCEWKSRPKPSKVCLIQMCLDSTECHLIHLSAMNYTIPPKLIAFLSHKNCIKVGLNIESDFWKLQRDYGLALDDVMVGDHKSIIDLSVLVNKMLGKTANWSLNRLSQYLFNKSICKDLQQSDWTTNPLTDEQRKYAAIDVFASYELYYEIKLNSMPFGYD